MRFRVDELAERAECTVDTIRFYQKRDLLPPPTREGRVAWYDGGHLTRLRRIRRLADAGLTLEQIGTLEHGSDPIVDVLTRLAGTEAATLDRDDLATIADLSRDVVDMVVDAGLITPATHDPETFTPDAAEMLRAGAAILAAGVDARTLAQLAVRHADHVEEICADAVEIFRRSVGSDRATTATDIERLVPLAVSLVAHHFHASLLEAAMGRAMATPAAVPEPR